MLSHGSKEAMIAMLGPVDLFGKSASAGQSVRIERATGCWSSKKNATSRLLHEQPLFADRFIARMLSKNIRIEADLVDRLFNSSEKRLARALLLSRYRQVNPPRTLPKPD